MTIECVTQATNHLFSGNPLADQYRLRYNSIISRQDWDVPHFHDMEYDQYDTPATTYLIWRGEHGKVQGVSRLAPTDRPFMLDDAFAHLVTYQAMPKGAKVWEGSRFCIDKTLPVETRKRVAQEIVVAYLEYGLKVGIHQIIGVMYPVYWNNLFCKNGWDTVWIGDTSVTPDGKKSRAAILPLSEETLQNVRKKTGIHHSVISYGQIQERTTYVQAA